MNFNCIHASFSSIAHHDMRHCGEETLDTPIIARLLAEALPLARPQYARQLANVLFVHPDANGR